MSASVPARRDDVVSRQLGDETVVYDQRADIVHNLTPFAASVLDRCDGRSSVALVARDLGTTTEQVERAIVALDDAGLLRHTLSRRTALRAGATAAIAVPLVTTMGVPAASAAVSPGNPPAGTPGALIYRQTFTGGQNFETPGSSHVVPAPTTGSDSQSFTANGSGGDAFTRFLAVNGGATLNFSTYYETQGDGGFLGIDIFDSSQNYLQEQWVFGDNRYSIAAGGPSGAAIVVIDNGSPQPGQTFTAAYTLPANAAYIKVKTEDYGGSNANGTSFDNNPSTSPVFFDNIVVTYA